MSRNVGGASMADHYASARKRRGTVPAGPTLPEAGVHVWRWFKRLHRTRSWSDSGPSPISFAEIESFQRLMGADMADWEIEAIEALDIGYRDSQRESA